MAATWHQQLQQQQQQQQFIQLSNELRRLCYPQLAELL